MSAVLPVVAVIKAKAGKEKELERILAGLVRPTRQEAGCLQYDLQRSAKDPGTFVFIEKWTSPEVLEKHLQSSHVQAALRVRTS